MDRTPVQLLFVEDSEMDTELSVRALEQGGFDVSWQRVQAEGELKQALQSSRPQAVLSDFSMPGFDGIQALRVVREMSPGVPFIFVSGTIGEEGAIHSIRLGATDYGLKNNMRRLGTTVRRALSESADRDSLRPAAPGYPCVSHDRARHARAQRIRGAAAAFRQLRLAHHPADPHPARRPYAPGQRARPPQPPPGRTARAQPGPVQARQRERQPRGG